MYCEIRDFIFNRRIGFLKFKIKRIFKYLVRGIYYMIKLRFFLRYKLKIMENYRGKIRRYD